MSNIVRFDELRSMAFGSITSSFQGIGLFSSPATPSPLVHAMRVLVFQNTTNVDIYVSFDGTTVNAVVPSSSFSLYDLTSDQDTNEKFRYQSGTQIYIKYASAPTSGSFYLTAIYGKGE
jgi:hypothetical protein